MRQDELHPAPGSRKRVRRLGRGYGSGRGGYAGRGCKGQKARSSVDLPRGFEGGQIPLTKRLPQKRGFKNIFKVKYNLVSLEQLNVFKPESEITPDRLMEAGIVKSSAPVKVLASGKLDHPLVVKVNRFSATAKAKIEAVGGKAEELENAAEAE